MVSRIIPLFPNPLPIHSPAPLCPCLSERLDLTLSGKHACPGRHLALVVVKLIVIEFLETYEYKLIERPKDWSFGFAVIPNMRAPVYIRRKEGL